MIMTAIKWGWRTVSLVVIANIAGGCVSHLSLEKLSVQAPYQLFTEEMDEPAGRGQVSRVTPQNYNVFGRIAFSHDGKNLVFAAITEPVRSRGSYNDNYVLWKLSFEGGLPTRLTTDSGVSAGSPAYTSDDSEIVYSSGGRLWKIHSDGRGGMARLQGSGMFDYAPQVSSKSKVVFCSLQRTEDVGSRIVTRPFIWLCDLDGRNLIQMREGDRPSWSPDGNKIAFCYEGDIWIMGTDGGELTRITETKDIYENLPCFSPDGSALAYVSNENRNGITTTGDYNIWKINLVSGEKSQLTTLSSWDSWPLWTTNGIYFLSSRGCSDARYQRVWKLLIK